jgi:ArsR family transcriptional regulator
MDTGSLKYPDGEEIYDCSELFKLFGDVSRLNILCALIGGERCVEDLTETLNISQSAVSHQLRILKTGRLVKGRRDGKRVYYSLADDHVYSMMRQALEHVREARS